MPIKPYSQTALPAADSDSVYGVFLDFIDENENFTTSATSYWSADTANGTPSFPAQGDAIGGELAFGTGGTDTNDTTITGRIEFVQFEVEQNYYFSAKMDIDEATDADWTFGFMEKDYTINVAPAAGDLFVGFEKDDTDTNIDVSVSDGTTQNRNTAVATADTAEHVYEIEVNMSDTAGEGLVMFLIDGNEVHREYYTNLPTGLVTYGFGLQTGATAAVTATLDWVACYGTRA